MIILKIAEALNRPKKDERGFTLIELLIVIAILAILAAIAIPLVGSRVEKARIAADIANVRVLQGAVDLWEVDKSDDPAAVLGTGVGNPDDSTNWMAQLIDDNYLLEKIKNPFKDSEYTLVGPTTEPGKQKAYRVVSNHSDDWYEDDSGGGSGDGEGEGE